MGDLPGADSPVWAAVVDGSGNLYIGGDFAVVGNIIANHIAKWNGSSWRSLGSGMNNGVRALAVSGSVTEVSAGQFQFTDPQATNSPQRYYRIRWP